MIIVAPGILVQLVTDVPLTVAGHSISLSAITQAIWTRDEETLLNFRGQLYNTWSQASYMLNTINNEVTITTLAEMYGLQQCSQIMLTLRNNWPADSQRSFTRCKSAHCLLIFCYVDVWRQGT
jgi:hypothetical protein